MSELGLIIKFIGYSISLPFKKLYNLLILRRYVPDNERNIQLLEYLWKIVQDPIYQPSTPVENYTENRLIQAYNSMKADMLAVNIPVEEYERIRYQVAAYMIAILESHMWIDDTKSNISNFATPFK